MKFDVFNEFLFFVKFISADVTFGLFCLPVVNLVVCSVLHCCGKCLAAWFAKVPGWGISEKYD